MKRFLLLTGIALGAAVGWLAFDPPAPREVSANSALPPLGVTGAPPGEGTCFNCHAGALNDGVGSVTITGMPTPYMPGQTYTLGVTVQRTGQSRWGFEITALKASDNTAAGILSSTAQLTDTTRTFSGRMYVSHTTLNGQDGTFLGSSSGVWTFSWTAPAAGAGAVTFYAAGNAANGNGSSTGDFIYTTNASSMEGTATDVSATTWGRIKMLYR